MPAAAEKRALWINPEGAFCVDLLLAEIIFAKLPAGFAVLDLLADGTEEVSAEEQEYVQKGHEDGYPERPGPQDQDYHKVDRVQNGQVLDLIGMRKNSIT